MAVASVLACSEAGSGAGSGGGLNPDPVGACNDYCDRVSRCEWHRPALGPVCEAMLCEGNAVFFEGEYEGCDEATAAYFKCGTKASCVSFEEQPCPGKFAKMVQECPFAFAVSAKEEAAE